MRFLLEDPNFPGSEADESLPKYGGDSFGRGIDPDAAPDILRTPGTLPTPLPNPQQQEKSRLIEEAKKIMRRGIGRAPGRLAARVGAPTNIVRALREDTPEGRQEVKDFAKDKTRKFAKDKIGNQLKGGIQKGFQKGIKDGAGKALKEGGKKALKSAGQKAGKALAKDATKLAVKGAEKAIVKGGGAILGAGTFGLGFVLALFLDIAISLGINDAIDAVFELKEGNVRKATFLGLRAAVKVEVFVWMLLTVILMFSVAGIFIAIPSLVLLNIYMIIGSIPAFKGIPHFQGMVLWEKIILIAIDIIAFLILVGFLAGLVYYLCTESGLGSGGVTGTATGIIASGYDRWTGGTAGTFANTVCQHVQGTIGN